MPSTVDWNERQAEALEGTPRESSTAGSGLCGWVLDRTRVLPSGGSAQKQGHAEVSRTRG